jgi:hypothetical protein
MYIHMYIDKPGYYLNEHGREVPSSLAAQAGFDVAKFNRERIVRERMIAFQGEVIKQLDADEESEVEILAEGGGYKVVAVSKDAANVYDEFGSKLNGNVLPRSAAMNLFQGLTRDIMQAKVEALATVGSSPKSTPSKG